MLNMFKNYPFIIYFQNSKNFYKNLKMQLSDNQ